jgi:hypothetical protein
VSSVFWRIRSRHFASPEDEAPEAFEFMKSREAIKTVHLEGTHGSDRGLQERSR